MAQSHLDARTYQEDHSSVSVKNAEQEAYNDDDIAGNQTSLLAYVPSSNNKTNDKAFVIANENKEEEEDEAELSSLKKHVKTINYFTVFVTKRLPLYFGNFNRTSHQYISYSSSYRCILFGVIRI
jgi:hypothetical protein